MGTDKRYRFGTVVIRVISDIALKEDERFEAFVVNESLENFSVIVHALDKSVIDKDEKSFYSERTGNTIHFYINEKYIPNMTIANLFSGAKAAVLLPEKSQFILHAAYIVHEGKAILFSAPSGTGKSTQARYWEMYRNAEIVNEDRVIITCEDGIYYANGCWAMGKSHTCKNIKVPIRAVILLEQGKENKIKKLHAIEKYQKIVIQCSFDDKEKEQCNLITNMVLDMIENVPIIGYACVNDSSSVEGLEKYL